LRLVLDLFILLLRKQTR